MFWGMNLKPNRKYSQTTSKSFHISQAALDCEGLADEASNKIYISGEDNQKYLICTLRKNVCEQAMLDLNFAEGDTICFQSIGSGSVSLSGYLTVDPEMFSDEEEEEISDAEENVAALPNGKNSKKKNQKKSKGAAESDEDEDDDDDEDDDALLKAALGSDDAMDSDDDEEDEEDDGDEQDDEDEEEDEDEEDDDDEVEEPKPKVAKVDKKETKQQQQNGVAQKSKKEKKAEKQQQQQSQQKGAAGGERTLAGGVKVEDIRVGNGPEAKTGKRAQVYYEGRLKSNNKTFDSLKNGAPFKFGIGRGEVIKGWDVGVVGMKVGGKRRITCPPHMAYGARGSPPAIPPNSTLVFEVELKGVN